MTFPFTPRFERPALSLGGLLAFVVSLGLLGCGAYHKRTVERRHGRTEELTAFRVRLDFTAELNADRGWAGGINENVSVQADEPFRLRIELQGSEKVIDDRQFHLQYRRNGGDWQNVKAEDFPTPEDTTPRVSIISTAAYDHGAPTADLLMQSSAIFRAGAGIALAATTPSWSGGSVHGEWEWPLVIRRFADGAVTNEEGDTFEFRMAATDGALLDSTVHPVITLSVPSRHVGGTFVETPGRIGPWQASNDDLYFIVEPTETDNLLMMVKSVDRGKTWLEVDGTNRPFSDDLEGVASALWGDTIHLLHQTSDAVWHHTFRTSDHPEHPDTWDVRDALVAIPEEPPTQVASVAVRSDGSIVGVYGGPAKIHFKIRSSDGNWSAETVIDAGIPPNLSGPQTVLGAGDVVHLAYTGNDGTVWYRRLQPNGILTRRVLLAEGLGRAERDACSILPLIFIPETNTLVVIYRLATGRLWERRIIAHGTPSDAVQVSDRNVIQNAVDSDQTGADAIAVGRSVHVMFIEQFSGSIYHTHSVGGDAVWHPSTLQIDGIRGQWIRGTLQCAATVQPFTATSTMPAQMVAPG